MSNEVPKTIDDTENLALHLSDSAAYVAGELKRLSECIEGMAVDDDQFAKAIKAVEWADKAVSRLARSVGLKRRDPPISDVACTR